MTATHTADATTDTFTRLVVEVSQQVPVLVDFWAPWCGPCKQLAPVLERLAEEYAGRFKLVKVNTDEEQALASEIGIRSLPTVALFKAGAIVEHFVGVVPETQIKSLLDKHVAPAAKAISPIEAARAKQAAGDIAGARTLLFEALSSSPGNVELQGAMGEADVLLGNLDEAKNLLDTLRSTDPAHAAVKRLAAMIAFGDVVREFPAEQLAGRNPDALTEPAVGHAIAVHHLLSGDHASALGFWLDLLRRNRTYGDDLARKSLVRAFELIGETDPLVSDTRRQMARILF